MSRENIQEVMQMSMREIEKMHTRHLNPVSTSIIKFIGANRKFVKAKGAFLYDEQGNKYLDFLSGYGSVNLGHEPAEVLDALRAVEGSPNIFQAGLNPFAAKLAERLSALTPGNLSRSFFCNSGAESIEAAIKLARCYTGRKKLLYAENAFHGKTHGALSVSGKEKYKKPFEPLVPDVTGVAFNDCEALEKELAGKEAAGFIVEPIQGEAGVIVPAEGYLKEAQNLCREYGTLFIVDEIQTGMGRTGKLFCCEHGGVEPDILCLAKSLGGGVMPIGAMITTDKIWKKAYGNMANGLLHTSTFGGNTRACACGYAALQVLLDSELVKNAEEQGEYLIKKLFGLKEKFAVIKDVRGKGLMIGIQFSKVRGSAPILEGAISLWVVRQLLRKHRIVTAFTLNNYDVLRIMPPLCITCEQVDEFIAGLEDVLHQSQIITRLPVLQVEAR